jgi:hypothetical protein
MISALILVISMLALIQFAVYSWRAAILTIAFRPISERTRATLGVVCNENVESADFAGAAQWLALSPSLDGNDEGTRSVRAYAFAVRAAGAILSMMTPTGSEWAEREVANCTRYMAVLMDARIERNQACMAAIRSY